jgi:hypothetical protein
MSSVATANSTGERGEEIGRLDKMSAGSVSLPELLQEPLILPPRSDLRTFLARSCFSSNSTKRARSGGREPGMLRSSLNFLPNTLGVAAWSSICPPTFDQPTRSALERFLTKHGVFTSGGCPLKGALSSSWTSLRLCARVRRLRGTICQSWRARTVLRSRSNCSR